MKKYQISILLFGLCFWGVIGYGASKVNTSLHTYFANLYSEANPTQFSTEENKNGDIQVALLLDTSGSMSGLIEQAKSQLWNILNELARTEINGNEVNLEVALFEYGNPSKTKNSDQINRLTEFTSDMDLISEKLFELKTEGGDEYCGTVIQEAIANLYWNKGNGLKLIYIAGNEPFTQGMVSFETACGNAVSHGITINTIYCGKYNTGIQERWKEGALAGGGDYLNIDHNQETAYIATPYDDQLKDLNVKLNKTYIPYGKEGALKSKNQISQDANSSVYGLSNVADRAAFKSSKKYKNTGWDLVDAYNKDKSVLQEAEVAVDSLQNISMDELETMINEISAQRTDIQSEIQSLDKKRRKFKAKNAKLDNDDSLQQKMIKSIQKQASEKGYKVKE